MADNTPYYLAFSHFLGIGPHRFKKLMLHLGSVKDCYETPEARLNPLLGPIIGEKFARFRHEFQADKKLQELIEKRITVITTEDPRYPDQLKNISDPPICLYVKGNPKLLSQKVDKIFAIVGTRNPTSYGRKIARQFASDLSRAGFTIVSGMALGLDSIAHEAALDVGSSTIAVLGCGVDIIYPPSHRHLYQRIISSNSIVMSEFPPGMRVAKGLFIARNRIISGLSRGVMVVEGATDSGSLITARYAAEQGRDVFAPPSPITSHYSQAPNRLLKQGAIMVTSTTDILDEYQIKQQKKRGEKNYDGRNEFEKRIIKELASEPCDTDDLARSLKTSLSTLLSTLTTLELEHIIEKTSDSKYVLTN